MHSLGCDTRLKSCDFFQTELITKYGYNAEVHSVTTEDGYILELQRIAGSPKSPPSRGKKIAMLLHGSEGSAATFVLSSPSHALGILDTVAFFVIFHFK